MARNSYGYGAYRGRGGSKILKGIIVVLFVVLLIAVAAFFYLPRYMVYADDGTVRLDLPFLREDPPTVSPTQAPVVVTPTPTPTPTKPETMLPVVLPPEALWDGSAVELVAEGGGNAAVFDLKTDAGELMWVSETAMAIDHKATSGEPGRNEAILAGQKEGLYRVARLSCFRDGALGADETCSILTNSGYRWKDQEEIRWSSPTNTEVRTYLATLCKEVSMLGFDEILLDYAGYPTQGHLSYIKKGAAYDAAQFENIITGFYREVVKALEGSGVALSVVFDAETAPLSGQSLTVLEELDITPVTRGENGAFLWPTEKTADR